MGATTAWVKLRLFCRWVARQHGENYVVVSSRHDGRLSGARLVCREHIAGLGYDPIRAYGLASRAPNGARRGGKPRSTGGQRVPGDSGGVHPG